MTLATTPAVHKTLRELGLAIHSGTVLFEDVDRASRCYVHHSTMPVALLGYALAEPNFCRGRFPKADFLQMIAKRSKMDGSEIHTLAALGGVATLPAFGDFKNTFGPALWRVVETYELHDFFLAVENRPPPPSHLALRPRAIDWLNGEDVIPEAMKEWRRRYKALPLVRQLMAATVLTLYRGDLDKLWLVRAPRAWHPADAIDAIREGGALRDWAELIAMYPGW